MTTHNEAMEVIAAAWVAGWSPSPSVSYSLDNEELETDALVEWAELSITTGGGGIDSLGTAPNRVHERLGRVAVRLFVAENTGLARLNELAALASDIFESKTLGASEVFMYNSDYRQSGLVKGKYRGVVSVDFTYDEHK